MNNLELRTLYKYCDKYGLDYQEIDDTLTYWENKKHLKELATMLRLTGDCFELARIEALQEQYMKERPLDFYAVCQLLEPNPKGVGEPVKPFSLKDYVPS